MFDLQNQLYNQLIVAPFIALIHIKHVYSSVSYQKAIYQKYDRRGHKLPSGYGPYVSGVRDFFKYL